MTHGCLKIIETKTGRTITLHTFHTEQDIPRAVGLAMDVIVQYNLYALKHHKNPNDLREGLNARNAFERMEYANSTAALIIAAIPCFLEPLTNGSRNDLPKWSGLKSPYVLKINPDTWTLFDEDGSKIEQYKYKDIIISKLWSKKDEDQKTI